MEYQALTPSPRPATNELSGPALPQRDTVGAGLRHTWTCHYATATTLYRWKIRERYMETFSRTRPKGGWVEVYMTEDDVIATGARPISLNECRSLKALWGGNTKTVRTAGVDRIIALEKWLDTAQAQELAGRQAAQKYKDRKRAIWARYRARLAAGQQPGTKGKRVA